MHRVSAAISIIILANSACSSRAHYKHHSQLDFSHYKQESLLATPVGRLAVINNNLGNGKTTIRFCVENRSKTISTRAVLVETQLALVAWLNAAGTLTENDWARFDFFTADDCINESPAIDGYVKFPHTNDTQIDPRFAPQLLHCVANTNTKTCSVSDMTLGFGGPGESSYWYITATGKWTKVDFPKPASAELSPYVDWLSIAEDLAMRDTSLMNLQTKQQLLAEYDKLMASPTPTLRELTAFSTKLADLKLVALPDLRWQARAENFYASNHLQIREVFRMRRASFPTLLHEIGHQMGMDHSHHPGFDSISGQSDTTKRNSTGTWITDQAAMAYGLPFLYLTNDDTAGVKSVAKSLDEYIKANLNHP